MAEHHTRERPQLCEQEEQQLKSWLRRRKAAQSLALQARIILACAAGKSDGSVVAQLGAPQEMVGKRRRRFVKSGWDGLLHEPQPGASWLMSSYTSSNRGCLPNPSGE